MSTDRVKLFFEKAIEPDQFAKMMRRYNCEVVRMHLALQQHSGELTNPKVVADTIYWLNELAEAIDPYFDDNPPEF
ncbi:MAG: hypothetical protein H3C41_09770 [Bacteroidales bacterium]|nr:hypothetical protein [Bacteroidales bacterium]